MNTESHDPADYRERTDAVMARLLDVLDPRGDVDRGLAVTIAHDLADDAQSVLTELIGKTVARARAEAYERGRRELIDDLREVGGIVVPADYSAATVWQRVRDIIDAEGRE